jgi:phosphomannomutase
MTVPLPDDLIVGVSGFRGRVARPLTPELIASLAAHFGAFLRAEGEESRTVILGRDSRTSGEMYADAARAGLLSVGMDVVDLGIVPTPTLLLAAEDDGAAGALGVTASHNPSDWNALKFGSGEGLFLDAATMGRFLEFLEGEELHRADWDALGRATDDRGAVARHVDRILDLPLFDVEGIRARRFHVAVDGVHGAAGVIIPQLLDALGCRVEAIGMDPDGWFPREPEPIPENLGDLGELVRSTGAEIGFALDPDVDRLSLVDGSGVPVGEDLTLALSAAVVLERERGPVVTNLSTSQVVDDVARAAGVPCVRAPVGEINVARRMEAEAAVIGGEGNGGVILPQLHLTRDAPLGVALILQHLLSQECTLRVAVDRWPRYHIVKEKVEFPRDRVAEAYASLATRMAPEETDTQDGLRLSWPSEREWLHVRPSGTEPVVRFIAESSSRDRAIGLVERAREILGA